MDRKYERRFERQIYDIEIVFEAFIDVKVNELSHKDVCRKYGIKITSLAHYVKKYMIKPICKMIRLFH